MPVKIRLQRKGRKKRPFYHIVVADARAPRDGRFIEKLGTYNPLTKPATIDLDRDKAFDWLLKGAQPTETARAILRFKGIYYRKHLMRGVKKGALTQEQADKMYQDWIEAKEAKITARFEETAKEKAEFWAMINGQAAPPSVEAEGNSLDAEATAATESAEEAAVEEVEEQVEEAASAEEEVQEEPVEEVAEAEAPAEEKTEE